MSVGLVLEGGGMRGAYTAGVLDELLKNQIQFPTVYAVSAGACCALSYLSGQYERNKDIFYRYVMDDRYVSVRNLRQTGSLFGFDFIFGELFQKLNPFDMEAFRQSPMKLMAGATNLLTGRTDFFTQDDMDDRFLPVRASSSLPFLSPIVKINGQPYLDGGVASPVPYARSLEDGNRRNVVVLTRDFSFRKRAGVVEYPRAVIRAKYHDYPAFVDTLQARPDIYNCELAFIHRQERAGTMVVIYPSAPINISRYEKNPETLMQIYRLGRSDTAAKLQAIRALLEEDRAAGASTAS